MLRPTSVQHADTRAVRPTVKGTAGLLGTARWMINRRDPVDAGFLVA